MPDEEDWLWRPASEGLCKYESVIDGTLDLGDLATMNDILSVRFENQRRLQEAAERSRQ
ncbi:DUF6889 family protein [Paraburkholderia sp. BCC1885]|uniref:DUF6889 family protein n=1 Tax=Paraburkholderia sp. BCC1885 TaxID=2562669 RepID=UPI00391FA1B1